MSCVCVCMCVCVCVFLFSSSFFFSPLLVVAARARMFCFVCLFAVAFVSRKWERGANIPPCALFLMLRSQPSMNPSHQPLTDEGRGGKQQWGRRGKTEERGSQQQQQSTVVWLLCKTYCPCAHFPKMAGD